MSEEATLTDLATRVARIEERLATAPCSEDEEVARAGPSSHDRPSVDDPGGGGLPADAFWALNSLKTRQPQPAVLYTGHVLTAGDEPVEWQMSHDASSLVEEDWTDLAPTLAALGHPSRLRILQLICRGDASTAADLAHTDGLGTTGQIYHHLRQLVAAGWLRNTTKGQHQVPPERLVPLLVILGASH